jgi:hypothetical protein
VVHIYDGVTTSLTPSFITDNFAACPPELGKGENTLAAKLEAALTSPSGSYTIGLDGKETDLASFTPYTLSVTDGKEIAIAIRGNGQTVQLGSNGSLFTLNPESGSKLTLVVQDITLKGKSNNAPMVQVNSGGTLEVKAGSNLTGNTFSGKGGGVSVANGGILNMSGGAVSGNSSIGTNYGGGGVYVASNATFTMTYGTIRDNSAFRGGGVEVRGTFSMSGGTVSDNTATQDGGGLIVYSGGKFNMSGGVVNGNKANYGGGVYLASGGFTMTGGVIYGSEAENGSKANKATDGKSAAIFGPGITNETIDKRTP